MIETKRYEKNVMVHNFSRADGVEQSILSELEIRCHSIQGTQDDMLFQRTIPQHPLLHPSATGNKGQVGEGQTARFRKDSTIKP